MLLGPVLFVVFDVFLLISVAALAIAQVRSWCAGPCSKPWCQRGGSACPAAARLELLPLTHYSLQGWHMAPPPAVGVFHPLQQLKPAALCSAGQPSGAQRDHQRAGQLAQVCCALLSQLDR